MRHIFRKSRVAAIVGVVAVVSAATMALVAPSAFGSDPSDARADFHGGNATNCGTGKNGIGLTGASIAYANGTNPITTGPVQGSVTDGTKVNITNPGGATILAVVVKGGPAYNVYSANSGTPPANYVPPGYAVFPQNYISPYNGGQNIPTVSHWFICYTPGEVQPTTGSLEVTKEVVPGPTEAVVPTSFHIIVDCTDNTADTEFDIVDQETVVVPNIAAPATCTVTETNLNTGTPPFPLLSTVTVNGGPTVTVEAGSPNSVTGPSSSITAGGLAQVTVTNTFGGVAGIVAGITVSRPPALVTDPVVVSPAFTG